MQRILFIIGLIFFGSSVFAQQYYQQEVNYVIQVKLDDNNHMLRANETIEYTNNSPDELHFIYFHIWPNAYKNSGTALARQLAENGEPELFFADENSRGFMDSLDFRINTEKLKWEIDPVYIDICKVYLNQPLKPGEKITINTPFRVKIPSSQFSRLGHDRQAYYISQWYPKPAVYDRDGWHQMPYLDQGEFYSEYGSFDVRITLPKNYVLGATGDRTDAQEEEAWMHRRFEETMKKIKNLKDYKKDLSFPPSDAEFKTIRFRQNNVHDFAWFADKRYNVLKGIVELPDSKREVQTWALFTDNNIEYWQDAIGYISDATFFYSLWNGEYPYNHVTAVDGVLSAGGGMEYPNITLIGEVSSAFLLDVVITHEVGHNWFYGIMGSNEREHGWMDEGINSFNELRYVETKYPGATISGLLGRDSLSKFLGVQNFKHHESYRLMALYQQKQNLDQPIETHSADFTNINYGAIMYSKTATVFNYLRYSMGDVDFDKAMHFYFENWKFKHPQPEDLRKTFEYYSEKNLSWFFDDLIKTRKKLDYKILRTRKNPDNSYSVIVKNTGEIVGPVVIYGIKDNRVVGQVWYDGFNGKKELGFPPSEIDRIVIDYEHVMPESNHRNNLARTGGLFRRMEPLHFSFIAGIENERKTHLYFSPVAGYNAYNGPMAGIALYNQLLFPKTLEFCAVPMYGFTNKQFAGFGWTQLNFFPKKLVREWNIGVSGERFGYNNQNFYQNYFKVTPFVQFNFKKRYARSPYSASLNYRYVFVERDINNYHLSDVVDSAFQFKDVLQYAVHDASFLIRKSDFLYPFTLKWNYQGGRDIQRMSFTGDFGIRFNPHHTMNIRFFAGKIFYMNAAQNQVDFRYRLAGQRGAQDFLFDQTFIGRTETTGLGYAQFAETEGAMKVNTVLGQSRNWVMSMNVKSPRIFKLPLLLFMDVGACDDDGMLAGGSRILMDAGINVQVIKNVFDIYFPLVITDDIRQSNKTNGINFAKQIRFSFNLKEVSPAKIVRNNLGV